MSSAPTSAADCKALWADRQTQDPRGTLPAGVFFCADKSDNGHSSILDTNEMTDRRPLLRAIFDAAVAAAHPDVVLGAHLPPAPKGRVICLAAGKGAAAMAVSAERHYLDAVRIEPQQLV